VSCSDSGKSSVSDDDFLKGKSDIDEVTVDEKIEESDSNSDGDLETSDDKDGNQNLDDNPGRYDQNIDDDSNSDQDIPANDQDYNQGVDNNPGADNDTIEQEPDMDESQGSDEDTLPQDSGTNYYVCGNMASCNSGYGSGWQSGNDSNSCTNRSEPCLTVMGAISKLSGGDNLIIGDGTYINDVIVDPPSGTPEKFTVVRAENDGSVVLDDTHSGTAGYPGAVLSIGTSYVKIQGIKFQNGQNRVGGLEESADKVYIKNCAFINADATETSTVLFANSASNSLVEDCWFAGGGRYLINDGRGRYNVYRRCVGRWDYSRGNRPIGGFMNYHEVAIGNGTTASYQNCIAIDFNDPIGHDTWLTGGFADKYGHNITRNGSIAMNILSSDQTGQNTTGYKVSQRMVGFFDEPSDQDGRAGINVYKDNVTINAFRGLSQVREGTTNIENMTFVNSTHAGINYATGNPGISLVNGLFVNNGADSTTTSVNYSYSHFQDETSHGSDRAEGESGLLYPVRVEAGSSLYGSGENAGNRGATILKRIGVEGTFYGEPGWDIVTEEDLWPFPNEDMIKADFAAVPGTPAGAIPEISNSKRGFADPDAKQLNGTVDVTLTSYIWESMGNPIPCEIYETCGE